MKSATDVLVQKNLPKDIFSPKFAVDMASLRAHPILKLLARLLPELYSTRSNYYF